ncbi:hypothetical protein B0J17DRAFT_423806 [Rhizoctonia solani]|nr:hypothetical protein B0J17DRAFT_423806 [Rhizoctonia solani]
MKRGIKTRLQNEKKPKQGNKEIVAALIDAINEDDWPMIIRYSTLDPRNLQGWYPGESEWLAAHRMSQAFTAIPEDKWDYVSKKGVISVPKLARILAKKNMRHVEFLPEPDDPRRLSFIKTGAILLGTISRRFGRRTVSVRKGWKRRRRQVNQTNRTGRVRVLLERTTSYLIEIGFILVAQDVNDLANTLINISTYNFHLRLKVLTTPGNFTALRPLLRRLVRRTRKYRKWKVSPRVGTRNQESSHAYT